MQQHAGPGELAGAPGPLETDFTSALYLGLLHPSESLRWTQLSTGTPAALRRSAMATVVEAALAELTGAARALVLTSTLHAFVDLFVSAPRPPSAVLFDEGVYPIARLGMSLGAQRGAALRPFRHLDPDALERRLGEAAAAPSRDRGQRRRWWIVTDGFCPGCARAAPLAAYARIARRFGARIIVDDTQSIGIYGREAGSPTAPYGRGGGGSLRRHALEGEESVVLIASLAKAFGAPLAMIAGSASFVDLFSERSETLVHCSPPAAPTLAAARRALALNATQGETLRARLLTRVRGLRAAFAARGFPLRGGAFPMQRLATRTAREALALHQALRRRGIDAVVRRSRCNDEVSLTFIVTARHRAEALRGTATALAAVTDRRGSCSANRTRTGVDVGA